MEKNYKQSVSIIIPSRNEVNYIERCIQSVLNSVYPKELLSIYVVDGKSDDGTKEIVEKLAAKNSNIHLIINHKQTTPFALNLGIKASKSDIKIILGAHSTVDEMFVAENLNAFEIDESIGCTGGVIINKYENETAEIIGLAMSSNFGVGNAHFRTGLKSGFVDTVAFGAYKASIFEEIGFFDETLSRNQDDEFNYRLLKSGSKIYLSSAIKSLYYVRGTFKKLARQYYQYGYWKVFVNKKHKTITTWRQLIPLAFVLYLILGLLLSLIVKELFLAYCAVLLIYFLTAFYASTKLTNNFNKRFGIIYSFLVLHLTYGYGYLVGVIHFLILNKNPMKSSENLSR